MVPRVAPPPQVLFKYPLGPNEPDRVTLLGHDAGRLEDGEFLNDNVIDFFFK